MLYLLFGIIVVFSNGGTCFDTGAVWGIVDLKDYYDPMVSLHISRSMCKQDGRFFPEYIIATAIGENTGKVTSSVRRVDPTMYQSENDLEIYIWQSPNKSAVNLPECSTQTTGKLCRLTSDPLFPSQFFDATEIYYSNEFIPIESRLIVSDTLPANANIFLPNVTLQDSTFNYCKNNLCLPYFHYNDELQRCKIGCRLIEKFSWDNSRICPNETDRPQCHLHIAGNLIYGHDQIGGTPASINVTIPDFMPFNISLVCKLPPGFEVIGDPKYLDKGFDPVILLKKDGVAFLNTSMIHSGPFNLTNKVPRYSIALADNSATLRISLLFDLPLTTHDLAQVALLSGEYKFLLSFKGLLTAFDPHENGVPIIKLDSSNSKMPAQLAGYTNFDSDPIDCRINTKGNSYQGRQNVSQCGNPCLPWTYPNFDPMHLQRSPFREYFNRTLAQNFCRQLYALPLARPVCLVGKQKWEYCDIPYCSPDINEPEGYAVRQNFNCECAIGSQSLALDIRDCVNACDSDQDCKGFTFHEQEAMCRFLPNCECQDDSSCREHLSFSYFAKISTRDETFLNRLHLNGLDEVLVKVAAFEMTNQNAEIRCSLFWRKNDLSDWSWEILSDNFRPVDPTKDKVKVGKSKDLFKVVTLNFNTLEPGTKVFRCSRKEIGSEKLQYEYHVVVVYDTPKCSVYLNQVLSSRQELSGAGFELLLTHNQFKIRKPNGVTRTVPRERMDIQIDVNCTTTRSTNYCNMMYPETCVPIMMAYHQKMRAADALLSPQGKNVRIYSLPPTNVSNWVWGAYISSYHPHQGKTGFEIFYISDAFLSYYPQLELSHMTQHANLPLYDLDSVYDQIPVPLVPGPIRPFTVPQKMAMTCNVNFVFSKGKVETSGSTMKIYTQLPVPFVVDFICKINYRYQKKGSFCSPSLKDNCHPINLLMVKDDRLIFTAPWELPAKSAKRHDNPALWSPLFTLVSPDKETLGLRLHFTSDPLDPFNATHQEQLLAGHYRLAFQIDIPATAQFSYFTGADLQIVSRSQDSVDECRPELIGKWKYTGRKINRGQCSKKPCLPWTNDLLDEMLVREYDSWWEKRRPIKYTFDKESSLNFCRNIKISSIGKLPVCVTEATSQKVYFELCDVEFCQGAGYFSDFERSPGLCLCSQNWSEDKNKTDTTIRGCRDFCLETKDCVGFNFRETVSRCDLLDCRCDGDNSDKLACNEHMYTAMSASHYYQKRTNPLETQASELDAGAIVKIHTAEFNTALSAHCGLNGDAFKPILTHDSGSIDQWKCQDSNATKFERHFVYVHQPPHCTVRINNKDHVIHEADQYEVGLADLDIVWIDRFLQFTFECDFRNANLGFCRGTKGEEKNLCNPEVKVFEAGKKIFHSYNGYNSSKVTLTVEETNKFVLDIVFTDEPVSLRQQTVVAFNFLPNAWPYFEKLNPLRRGQQKDSAVVTNLPSFSMLMFMAINTVF